MGVDTFDKRFALIAKNGELRFPYRKEQKSTNRYGFALSAPRMRDDASAFYTMDIEDVVKRMVFDGWKARVKTLDNQHEGSDAIGKRAISGYWIADELKHLVKGAKLTPSLMPGLSPSSADPLSRSSDQYIVTTVLQQTDISSNNPDENKNIELEHLDVDQGDSSLLADLDEIDSESSDENSPTERLDNRMSRIGQGKFRKNTIATWGGEERCAVTGVAIREVLTASHIIPWSLDVVQRKRGCNGILLIAHLDRLFDRHLIGFRLSPEVNVFSLVVAPRLADRFLDLEPLGVTAHTELDLSTVNPADRPGLETNLRAHLDLVLNNK